MAWRIDQHVVRGEIDNRMRGRTVGRVWFAGRAEPMELELRGDCWRDLAGRRLEFVNPEPQPGLTANFAARQAGEVGDITASRKVKVRGIPFEGLCGDEEGAREVPWHWGNALRLEWFSETNGRVVIESVGFELKIVGEPTWEMSAAEEERQKHANAAARDGYMAQQEEAWLNDRARDNPGKRPADVHGDAAGRPGQPMTEAEADAMQARSDLLNDRVQARIEREGDAADHAKILEEEIERLNREYPAPEPTPEQRARNEAWLEEFNRAPDADEDLENPDAEAEDDQPYEHPLVARITDLLDTWRAQAEAEEWIPQDAVPEHPAQELIHAVWRATVKLAVALNGRRWPPDLDFCALTIVQLKKAREYLDDALRATESCHEEKLLTPEQLGPILVDLIDLAHDANALIAELREKLERGAD